MGRRLRIVLTMVAAAILIACSSADKKLTRARLLEREGKLPEALQVYESALAVVHDPHTRSQLLLRVGECLYRLEKPAEAFNAFEKAAEADSTNLAAQLRLGEIYLSAGAAERAQQQAESVLREARGNSEAMALLAAAAAASGRMTVAREAYERVLEVDPGRVTAAVALADLYNRDSEVQRARKLLEHTAQLQPGSSMLWVALGRLHEQEGDTDSAERSYRKAVEAEDTPDTNLRLAQFLERVARVAEAEQVLRRVDAQRPLIPTALPDFELNSGRVEDASRAYETALGPLRDRKPGADRARNAVLAARLVEADLAVAERNPAQASSAIGSARAHLQQYRSQLDEATAEILEAEIALAEANLPVAHQHASRAAELAPDSAPVRYVLAAVKYRMGDRAAARLQWESALESDKDYVPAQLALASYLLDSGDLEAAGKYAVAVVRDEPGNMRGLTVFARILAAKGRLRSAILLARRAQALDANSPEPYVILGEIALTDGRLAEALVHFQQALLRDARSPNAIEGLTRVYHIGGISRRMLFRMEKVAAAQPASATLMEIAGRLYQARGWHADARRCLERALRIDPGRATAAAALARSLAANGQYLRAADSASRGVGNSAALLAAIRAEEGNDISNAIQHYQRAVREGENTGVAANNLAWLYAQQTTPARLDEALSLAETARVQAPKNPAVLDTLGVVHLRRREYSRAITALEDAERLSGSQAEVSQVVREDIRRHLREAYLRAGRPEDAFEIAQKRGPEPKLLRPSR